MPSLDYSSMLVNLIMEHKQAILTAAGSLAICIAIGTYFITMKNSTCSVSNNGSTDISTGLKLEQRGSSNNNLISMLSADIPAEASAMNDDKVLNAARFKTFKVLKVIKVCHNTKIIRIEIPFGRSLDLPIGRHVSVRATLEDGSRVMRAYTPTSRPDQKGFFDLMVKSYEFGKLSTHLHTLHSGSSIEIRGPVGRFKYQPNKHRCIGLVAAGTGLTPCLQVMRTVLEGTDYNDLDRTKFVLLFQNRTEEDVLLRDELDSLTARYSDRVRIIYYLSNPQTTTFGKIGSTERRGYIQQSDIEEVLAPSKCSFVCLCGPSGFNSCITEKLVSVGHVYSEASVATSTIYVW